MANKLGKVVSYHEEVPLVKLLGRSITQILEITGQIKYFISPLALDQLPPNMGSSWLAVRSFHP